MKLEDLKVASPKVQTRVELEDKPSEENLEECRKPTSDYTPTPISTPTPTVTSKSEEKDTSSESGISESEKHSEAQHQDFYKPTYELKSDTFQPLNLGQKLEAQPKKSSNPLDVANLTAKDPPGKRRGLKDGPKLWSPVEGLDREQVQPRRMGFMGEIDYSMPITTTYLKYMRSLGCSDEDALKFENKHVSVLIDRFFRDAISHYFY